MYNISHFKEHDPEVILEFIEQNPFALMTGSFSSGQQVATHVPVLLEERDGELFLQGHIMRKTDHHKAFEENPNTLLIFSGPSCYVSATWYSDPHTGSTWNYMSVLAAGQVRFMTNEELVSLMRKLTLKFEEGNTRSATAYDNLPDSYLNKMMPAIIGFEVRTETIDNTFKLSQNKDVESYQSIISNLDNKGGQSSLIASEMRKRRSQLFPDDPEEKRKQ